MAGKEILLYTDVCATRGWFYIDKYDVEGVVCRINLGYPLSYRFQIIRDLLLAGF